MSQINTAASLFAKYQAAAAGQVAATARIADAISPPTTLDDVDARLTSAAATVGARMIQSQQNTIAQLSALCDLADSITADLESALAVLTGPAFLPFATAAANPPAEPSSTPVTASGEVEATDGSDVDGKPAKSPRKRKTPVS